MSWCPKCKCEYRTGFTNCSDCGCELVEVLESTKEEANRRNMTLRPFLYQLVMILKQN